MKKVFFLLIAAAGTLTATAQMTVPTHRHITDTSSNRPKYMADSLLAPWVVDVNLLGGALSQNVTIANTMANYTNGVNLNTGNLKFTNGFTLGGDVQIGYFFGHKEHWGIGTGFMYLYQQGDMTLDNYHVEYERTDVRGDVYRQVVTANGPIKEALHTTNMNIPLFLKYKTRFSKTLGFTADAGLLFNIREYNVYKTNASFNYEAIYQHASDGSWVYDNSPTPDPHDVNYTVAQFLHDNPNGDVVAYFNTLRGAGYNVGLNQRATTDNGSVTYTTGSIGFMLQPSLSIYLSDNVALNVGLYYMYQSFKNSVKNGYRLTDATGDYTSVLNTVNTSNNQSYGLNVGVRFLFGRRAPWVRDEDAYDPSKCGGSDGKLAINGLRPDEDVAVNYYMNGMKQNQYNGHTDSDGTVTLNNLSAGNYDSIRVTTHKRSAMGMPATLINPPFSISFESSTNPTTYNSCDGTITLIVPRPGETVNISYVVDGKPGQKSAVVPANQKVVVGGLCGGNYTNISVSVGPCNANGVDVTLVAPAPPPPPPPPPPAITVSTPILFELNKTIIREDSHPIIELAVEKLNADKDALVEVNGYTDITGKPAYNKALSIRRAKAVKAELVKMGINPKRIKVIGHGAADPAASNDTDEGRARNRRAVMHLNIGE